MFGGVGRELQALQLIVGSYKEQSVNGVNSSIRLRNKYLSQCGVQIQYLRCDQGWVKNIFRKTRYDLILVDSLYYVPALILALAYKKRNTKVIISTHGALNIYPQELNKWFYIFFLRLFFNYNYVLAGKSESKIARRLNFKHIVLGNGIEFEKKIYKGELNSNYISLTYLGRGDFYGKGFDRMFDMLRVNTNVVINAYGKGLDKILVPIDLHPRFIKKQAVFGIEKNKVISDSHGIILLSRREGLPMSCLEALSLGKQIVVSRECNLDGYGVILYEGGKLQFELLNSYSILEHNKEKFKIENVVKKLLKYITES